MATHRKADLLEVKDEIEFNGQAVTIVRLVPNGGSISIDYETADGTAGTWLVSRYQRIPLPVDDGVPEASVLPSDVMRSRPPGFPPLPALADDDS